MRLFVSGKVKGAIVEHVLCRPEYVAVLNEVMNYPELLERFSPKQKIRIFFSFLRTQEINTNVLSIFRKLFSNRILCKNLFEDYKQGKGLFAQFVRTINCVLFSYRKPEGNVLFKMVYKDGLLRSMMHDFLSRKGHHNLCEQIILKYGPVSQVSHQASDNQNVHHEQQAPHETTRKRKSKKRKNKLSVVPSSKDHGLLT